MMADDNTNLSQYLRVYGVRLIEQKVSYELVLRVRIAATKFVTSALPEDLTDRWLANPHEGISVARDTINPLLDTLRHSEQDDIWQMLGLNAPDPRFENYFASRPALPERYRPVLNQSPLSPRRLTPLLPANRLTSSLVTAQRLLDATYSAILVVDAVRQLWHNWQKDKAEVSILEARRILLEDAVRATEVSQDYALQQALDPSFVEKYLLESGTDTTYDALFGETSDDTN